MIVGLRYVPLHYMAKPRLCVTGLKELSCPVHLGCGDSFGLAGSSTARLSGTPGFQPAWSLILVLSRGA